MRSLDFVGFGLLVCSLGACDGPPIEMAGPSQADSSGDALEDRQGEACVVINDERTCGVLDDGELVEGLQLCYLSRESNDVAGDEREPLIWSECIAAPECVPSESDECGTGAAVGCFVDIEGIPFVVGCGGDGGIDEGDTPLVMALGDAEIEFRAMPASASFDIAGDRRCASHDWPTAATPWLAIDLDGSGTIDGGHELFGSGSVLSSGLKASQGFEALAELDDNGDGVVSELDARWAELSAWSDYDGDKVTDQGELEPLSAFAVVEIPLAFERNERCDDRRNCGIEQVSTVLGDGGTARIVDVHMPCR